MEIIHFKNEITYNISVLLYSYGGIKLDKQKLTILGGDARSLELSKLLANDQHRVTLFGFDEEKNFTKLRIAVNFESAIRDAKMIISPLPFTNEKQKLNTPLYSGEISIVEIMKLMDKNQILLGGHIANKWFDLALENEVKMIDYFKHEELQVLNAVPTAEGAIQIAMEKTNITIHSSNVMVLGYGRVGKTLANMLHGIGANVYVCARDFSQLAWIKSYHYHAVALRNIETYLPKMNVIFNTIPTTILDKSKLGKLNKQSLIIDLASSPGGVDFAQAKKLGIETIWALALPGKVAPVSAAKAIKETIYNIMFNLEV